MTNPDTIIFLHIPKTAGTTLNSILRKQYEPQQTYFLGASTHESIRTYQELAVEEKEAIRLVSGHTAYGFHKYIPGSSTYFTFLRDPLERVVSFYHYVKNYEQHYLHKDIAEGITDIKSFAGNRKILLVDNGQTRLISGVWLDPAFGEITSHTFELAKANLSQHFSVVGLTERFDLSLLLLREIFNWQDIYYVRENVTKNSAPERALTADERETILSNNQWDTALYEYAQSLFEQQTAALGPDVSRQLKKFQRQNRNFQTLKWPLLQTIQRAKQYSVRTSIRRIFSH